MATDALRKAIDSYHRFQAELQAEATEQSNRRLTAAPTVKIKQPDTLKGKDQ